MAILTQYEQVVQEHICLYVYSVRLNNFRIFNDVKLIKNTMYTNNPLYYIHYYSGSNNTAYTVSPDAGEVIHSGGVFKVWLTKANDSVGVKSLLDAVDIYAAERIKKASDTIAKIQKQQDMAHETLDVLVKFKKSS